MKYLLREVAFGKLQAMVEGAAIVRDTLCGLTAPSALALDERRWGRTLSPCPSCLCIKSTLHRAPFLRQSRSCSPTGGMARG